MSTDLERRYDAAFPDVERSRATEIALDYAADTIAEAQRSRRNAWIAVAALIIVCGAQAAAIAIMLPLKDVVPYTILVDRQTGYLETVRGVEVGELKDDAAIVNAAIAQYVLQRETFDPADFEERYKRVALWSTGQARNDYVNLYRAGAPGNLLSQMRPGATMTVRVKNIELLDATSARVRFDLARRDPGAAPELTDWQALVTFQFSGAPMRMEDRLINPLGFQVTSYRKDAEFQRAPETAPPQDALRATSVAPTAPPATAPATIEAPPPAPAPRPEAGPTP